MSQPAPAENRCRVERCANKVDIKTLRLCGKHYRAHWRYGNPEGSPVKRQSVPCQAPGCDRTGSGVTGLCHKHYLRVKRTGRLDLMKSQPSECSDPSCERRAVCKGLCQSHYDKKRGSARAAIRTCSEPDCERSTKARGLCARHYGRLQRSGTLSGAPPVERATESKTQLRRCRGCSGDLSGLPRGHRYCSEDCKPRCLGPGCDRSAAGRGLCSRHLRQSNIGVELRQLDEHVKREPNEPCEWCAEPVGRGATARFCSNVCRNLARRHKQSAVCGECVQCGVQIDYLKPANGSSRRLTPISKRLCDDCRHRSASLYLSAEELRERDGDDCHLCGLPVPATARKPHPLAAEVDHILPVSRGGTHDPQNLALAHKTCNIAKGNKPMTWRRDPVHVAEMITEWNNGGRENTPPATCSVGDCERRPESHGMCQKHRRRVIKHGTPELPPRPTTCAVTSCGGPVRAQGLCRSHYRAHLIDGKRCTVRECDRQIHTRQRCRRHYQEWLDNRPGNS